MTTVVEERVVGGEERCTEVEEEEEVGLVIDEEGVEGCEPSTSQAPPHHTPHQLPPPLPPHHPPPLPGVGVGEQGEEVEVENGFLDLSKVECEGMEVGEGGAIHIYIQVTQMFKA